MLKSTPPLSETAGFRLATILLTLGLLFAVVSPVEAEAAPACAAESDTPIEVLDASTGSDEFSEFGDAEFEGFGEEDFTEEITTGPVHPPRKGFWCTGTYYVLAALLLTIIAGILVRFQATRKLRYLVLLASLVVLGFYRGGCPCMISGFQDFFFWLMGQSIRWHKLLWFLGLIPLAYLFGKVWCGWVCHLGAFQEFLYKENNLKFLQSRGFQKGLKITQYVATAVLTVQVFVTRTNIFIHYDPFKVGFNLLSPRPLGWVLLFILLLSSLLIYRPFCRGFCPIGLVLGWISRIPGAFRLQKTAFCNACTLCRNKCLSLAIDENCVIDEQECILCGDCLESCRRNGVTTSVPGPAGNEPENTRS